MWFSGLQPWLIFVSQLRNLPGVAPLPKHTVDRENISQPLVYYPRALPCSHHAQVACNNQIQVRIARRARNDNQKRRCFDWRFLVGQSVSSSLAPVRQGLIPHLRVYEFHQATLSLPSQFFAGRYRDKMRRDLARDLASGLRRHNRPSPFARECEQRNAIPDRCSLHQLIPARTDPDSTNSRPEIQT